MTEKKVEYNGFNYTWVDTLWEVGYQGMSGKEMAVLINENGHISTAAIGYVTVLPEN